jgi:hypothetical protein
MLTPPKTDERFLDNVFRIGAAIRPTTGEEEQGRAELRKTGFPVFIERSLHDLFTVFKIETPPNAGFVYRGENFLRTTDCADVGGRVSPFGRLRGMEILSTWPGWLAKSRGRPGKRGLHHSRFVVHDLGVDAGRGERINFPNQ